MVKPKQGHARRAPGKKQQNLVGQETELEDEEDWMVVKKQKITIIIPPLPGNVQSAILSVEDGQLQEAPRETKSHSPRKTNSEQPLSVPSASQQQGHESAKSVSLSPEQPIELPQSPHPTFRKSSSLCNREASDNSPLSFRERSTVGVGRCSKSKGNKGIMLFADSGKFLNLRMRAYHLERKLKKAGGLENWLLSLGLTCFIKAFKTRSINRFQLANLTMEKLKNMGTNAVGPRRKLMHAIDCICEPHCFQHM